MLIFSREKKRGVVLKETAGRGVNSEHNIEYEMRRWKIKVVGWKGKKPGERNQSFFSSENKVGGVE